MSTQEPTCDHNDVTTENTELKEYIKRIEYTNCDLERRLQEMKKEKVEIIEQMDKKNKEWEERLKEEVADKLEIVQADQAKSNHIMMREQEFLKLDRRLRQMMMTQQRLRSEGDRKRGVQVQDAGRSTRPAAGPSAMGSMTANAGANGFDKSHGDPLRMPVSNNLYLGNHNTNPREWFEQRCVIDNLGDFFGING